MALTFKNFLNSLITETLEVKNNKIIYIKQKQKYSSEVGIISTYNRAKDEVLVNAGQDVKFKSVYSLYNYKSGEETLNILTSLKGSGPYEMDDSQYQRFLDDSVEYAAKILSFEKTDFVVYPVSTSKLIKDFILALEKKLPEIVFLHDMIIKKQLKDIDAHAEEMLDKDYYGYAKLDDAKKMLTIKAIIRNVRKNEESGKGSILTLKDIGFKRDSHVIHKFMEIVNEDILAIDGKNVLIIDDLLGSGTSFSEMIRVVSEFTPTQVTGLTLFKRSGSK
jgi:hypothetical protein